MIHYHWIMDTVSKNEILFFDSRMKMGGEIDNEIIKDVVPQDLVPADVPTTDLQGHDLTAGFVDLQLRRPVLSEGARVVLI